MMMTTTTTMMMIMIMIIIIIRTTNMLTIVPYNPSVSSLAPNASRDQHHELYNLTHCFHEVGVTSVNIRNHTHFVYEGKHNRVRKCDLRVVSPLYTAMVIPKRDLGIVCRQMFSNMWDDWCTVPNTDEGACNTLISTQSLTAKTDLRSHFNVLRIRLSNRKAFQFLVHVAPAEVKSTSSRLKISYQSSSEGGVKNVTK